MITSDELRQVMGKFATGVTVIGSLEPDGTIHGMTANAVTSVSLAPPLVLVCIAHQNVTHSNIIERGRFAISILGDHQQGIAQRFGQKDSSEGSDIEVAWRVKKGGSPTIRDALAALQCRVVAHYGHGDHTVFVAEVEEAATGQGGPLVFYERDFHAMK